MYYLLMHKNTKVALCKEDKVVKLFEEKLLPYGTEKIEDKYDISKWKNYRKIPETRVNYRDIKHLAEQHNIKMESLSQLNHGLSLTDHYWFYEMKYAYLTILSKLRTKKLDNEIPKYDEISYHTKKFPHSFIEMSMVNREIKEENFNMPDNTTIGDCKKYWVVRNDKIFLAKLNDTHKHLVAEREMLASFVAYLINNCKKDAKKKIIPALPYQFEAGKNSYLNCCFTEVFTNMNEEYIPYELMKKKDNDLNEFDKMQEFIKEHIADITGLQDYFDFIILLDYLIENHRTMSDIGFIRNTESMKIVRPAPIFGNYDSFAYMTKDFTRNNHEPYNSDFINVFGMTEEEQCKYIVENIKWFTPQVLFSKNELLSDYVLSKDMAALTYRDKEGIINWLNYKLVLLQHTIKSNAIQNQMDGEENEEDEYEGGAYRTVDYE